MSRRDDIELTAGRHQADPEIKSSSLSSSFEHHRHQARRHIFSSTRDTLSRPRAIDSEHHESNILLILRLLSHYKIQVFPADNLSTQGAREQLGQGATFHVYASELPIWRALARFQYRDPVFPRRGERYHFSDHTETRWNRATKGAYKSLLYDEDTRRDQLMRDMVLELRILCQPSLQQHGNIVRLLGFTWIRDEQLFENANQFTEQNEEFGEPREWPTIVTEKAHHGSLRDFLHSQEYKEVPSSLRAKLLLCGDVLCGLVALHACNILHGDIKCDNALVYDNSTEGTAENWRVKLSDFSHSIDLNAKPDSDISMRSIRGTRLYNPPEVTLDRPYRDLQSMKVSDIWCFGLLMWEVMLDDDLPIGKIEEYRDQRCITIGRRRITPTEYCEEYLERRHPRERHLHQIVSNLLESCLKHDTLSRVSAGRALEYLQEKMAWGERYTLSQSIRGATPLASLDNLPFLDVSTHYYDLLSTLTVSQQVFRSLDDLVKSWPLEGNWVSTKLRIRLNAELQLGLCYASGFGVQLNGEKAIHHVTNAARAGFEEAGVVLPRLYASLGIPMEDAAMLEIVSWLEEACKSGSVTANQDLQVLRAQLTVIPSYPLQFTLRPRDGYHKRLMDVPPLHAAVLGCNIHNVARLIEVSQDVNARGVCGEVALHYTIFLPESAGRSIAELLLEAGANIFRPTSDPITFSEQPFILNEIFTGMTPLHLAISHDHIALVKLFMEYQQDRSDDRLWSPQDNVLALAARYQSLQCLEYLTEDRGWGFLSKEHVNHFDDRKLSPMYYACRPDIFDHIYRYKLDRGHHHPQRRADEPVFAKEYQVVGLLRSINAPLKIHQDDMFTVIHLLASFGSPMLLDRVLSENDGLALRDQRSEYGWTPLLDAIARGRFDTFRVLLNHNVQMSNIWEGPESNGEHTLHLCSMHPGSVAVKFVESSIKKDAKCLDARDGAGNTPLHFAAKHGQVQVIRYLAGHNAPLYARNLDKLTPLGSAIRSRTVISIRELCLIFEGSSLPPISQYSSMRRWATSIHPVCQFLYDESYANGRQYSEASLVLLKELLQFFPSRTVLGVNFIQNMLWYPIDRSGIEVAIENGRASAVKLLLESIDQSVGLSTSQLRRQLWSDERRYETSEEGAAAVIEEIWFKCDSKFRDMRTRRQTQSRWRMFWRTYYSLYGNLEHQEFGRTKEWLQKNYLLQWFLRPPLVYCTWQPTRLPLQGFTFLLLLVIELPALGYFIVIARDRSVPWRSSISFWVTIAFLLTNLMPFWTNAFRVTFVYFNSLKKEYSPFCTTRTILQYIFALLLIALSLLSGFAFGPPWEARLLSRTFWHGFPLLKDFDHVEYEFAQLSSQSQELINDLSRWCAALLTWHIVAITLLVAVCMFSLMDGFTSRGLRRKFAQKHGLHPNGIT